MLISPSVPSAIIPALPSVFFTQNCDVVPATTFEQAPPPATLQATKLFSKSDVEALQEEFLQVKDMGQGTVGEWLKGLPRRGSDLQHEASKWEKWESSGGTARMCSMLYPGYERRRPVSLPPKPSANPPHTPLPTQGRLERTAEEATELKASRKAEIERRSLLLDPPLTADLLQHIPSFQAATQLVASLDDDAWERLKPRLVSQRADAEKILQSEREAESGAKKQAREEQRLEATLAAEKEARDRVDKNWEEVQASLRAKIAGYADEVVRDSWAKGRKVTRENCSRFAVDSLVYVRKQFYAGVANDAAAARAAGKTPVTDPPEGPFTQKLTLENMKWIFDTKFKPHTEPLRKEIFYCNGCQGSYKSFGFEGVIQHYAAKHTGALSLGSIVVHWRAEWPEHPPFRATARPAKAPFHPHASSGFAANGGAPLPTSYSYPPPPGTVPAPLPPAYPPAAGYGYTPPTYNNQFQQQPPLTHPYQPQPAAPPPFASQPGYESQPSYANPPAHYPGYQPPPMPFATPAVEQAPGYQWSQGGHYDYQPGPYQGSNASLPFAPPQAPAYPDLHRAKMDDIARNSREVWRVLGDIRDLPGNVRVFVTLHHLVKRFRAKFYETPSLSMFIDGLSNNKEMRPVRNVNGLVCKACHLGLGNAASVERERTDFSLPQLANHFQSKHIEPMQRMQAASAPLDWVVDMVLVPDHAVTPSLASSANEPQKALLSAALPDAFTQPPAQAATQPLPQQKSRQYEQAPVNEHPSTAADVGEGPGTSNGHTSRSGAAESAGAQLLADYRHPGQSSHTTTPGTLSDNDRPAHSDAGRHSTQGRRANHGQKGHHGQKKAAGRNNRGKPQGGRGLGDRAFGKTTKTGGGKGKREEADVRAVRATISAETPAVHRLSNKPARPGPPIAPPGRAPAQPNPRPSQQPENNHLVHPANGQQESNIMTALESYLEQRQPPQLQSQQQVAPNPASDLEHRRDSPPSPAFQSGSRTYNRSADMGGPARSPLPASRGGNHDGRHVEPVYYPRPTTVERRESVYDPPPTQAGFVGRHAEEERFGLPAPRPADRGHDAAPPSADYRRYDEDIRVQSRAPIEAYEIVHVIDEHGEYYIRRPVRREPDLRYAYEERRVRHDSGAYPALELSQARERGMVAVGGRPADRRADPAYYEEYDPRFPAA